MPKEQSFKIYFNQILCEEMGKHFELKPLPLTPEFKERYSTAEDRNVCTKSQYLACDKTAGIRFGEMDFAGSMYVHYGSIPPAKNYNFPVFGFDFVYASKFLIGVIDLHPIARDKNYFKLYIDSLRDVCKEYEWIPKAEGGRREVHEWAKYYDSGFAFYRWCDGQYLPDLEKAFRDYIKVFCDCIKKASPITDNKLLAERNAYMERYRDDYTYKDPGSGPLKHYFGDDWGERYLKDFIFG
jgi:15,16-dihydrobiliverdin:ferredoxin oxidoreductase